MPEPAFRRLDASAQNDTAAGRLFGLAVRRPYWALALLCLALWVPPAILRDIQGADESRYTLIARELPGRSNWFALTLYGQPYDQKPPFAFWLMALAFQACGGVIREWALRAPSVAGGVAMVLGTCWFGRRWLGPKAGLAAGCVLLTSFSLMRQIPRAELDPLYAFFSTAAILAWLGRPRDRERLSPGRWLFVWGSLSLAFLTKGPLVPLIFASVLGFSREAPGRAASPWRQSRALPGFGLVLASALAWLGFQAKAYGAEFVQNQAASETVGRVLRGSHSEAPWYYLERLPTSVAGPAVFLALALLWRRRRGGFDDSAEKAIALGWLLVPFAFLCLATGKRVSYLLPLLPAISLLAAKELARLGRLAPSLDGKRFLIAGRVAAGACAVLAVAMALLAAGAALRPQALEKLGSLEASRGLALVPALCACALAFAAWVGLRERGSVRGTIFCVLAFQYCLGALSLSFVDPAGNAAESSRAFDAEVSRLLSEAGAPEKIAVFGRGDKEKYHAYARYAIEPIGEDLGVDGDALPDFLLAGKKDAATFALWNTFLGYRRLGPLRSGNEELLAFVRRWPSPLPPDSAEPAPSFASRPWLRWTCPAPKPARANRQPNDSSAKR